MSDKILRLFWTPEEKDALKKLMPLLYDKITIEEMEAVFGRNWNSISISARRLNIPIPKPKAVMNMNLYRDLCKRHKI